MVPFIADAGRREILRPAAVVVRFIKGGPLRGNEPPFSFRLRRKENGRSRSKEKALWRKTGAKRRFFCFNTGVVRIGAAKTWQASAGCALPLRNRERAFPHLGAWVRLSGWSSDLAPSGPARSASLRATIPYPREGFPQGRGRSPAPLCRFKGVRGDTSLFKRETSPLSPKPPGKGALFMP